MTEKSYNIYSKGKQIYQDLSEEEFSLTWDMINKFLFFTDTVSKDEITFEEIIK